MFVVVDAALLSMIDFIVWERIDFTLGNDFNQTVRGLDVLICGVVVIVVVVVCCFKYNRGIFSVCLNVLVLSGVMRWPVM